MVDSCRWSSACLCVLWSYNKQCSNGIIMSYISCIHTSPRHTDLRQLQGSRDKKQHEPSNVVEAIVNHPPNHHAYGYKQISHQHMGGLYDITLLALSSISIDSYRFYRKYTENTQKLLPWLFRNRGQHLLQRSGGLELPSRRPADAAGHFRTQGLQQGKHHLGSESRWSQSGGIPSGKLTINGHFQWENHHF